MNVFIACAALMTLLVVAWLIRPLLRNKTHEGITAESLNAAIHRDQLHALEADLARGVISQQDFEASRDELQLRLLDDTQSYNINQAQHTPGFWSARKSAVLVGISVPLLSLALYLQIGQPAAIDAVAKANVSEQEVRDMIDALAKRLKEKPDNPQGWAMLARSYKVMGRFDEAIEAFEKSGDLLQTQPDLLVDYADVVAVKAQGNLEGKPMELVKKALVIDPLHPMGLMISGVAAYRRSDFKLAINHWEKLMTVLEPGSPDAQQVESDIADARAKAGLAGAPKTALIAPPPLRASSAAETGKLPPVAEGAAAGMTPEMINQMVERLAARMKDNPGDLAGWARLARVYKVQGRTDDAAMAYEKTGKLMETDADLMTQYADLLATRAKGDFKGKPQTLIDQALKVNPKHPMALMMAGQSAYKSANYAKAIGHWETVLTVLAPGSSDAIQVAAEIADAKEKQAKR
ncbi:MAG: c-type cytochrome biogenesis protein CcmI [Rhodoferax sp.]|nr:c-type cytochrome biogenesis protein CcmI [Rhodoferax sp.]